MLEEKGDRKLWRLFTDAWPTSGVWQSESRASMIEELAEALRKRPETRSILSSSAQHNITMIATLSRPSK